MPLIDASPGQSDNGDTTREASAAPPQSHGSRTENAPHQDLTQLESWDDKVKHLRSEATKMRDDRRKVMRSLKNSMAKAKRLRDKARTLSEEDMLQILKMRRASSSTDSSSPGSAAASSGSGTAAPSNPANTTRAEGDANGANYTGIETRFDE